MVFIMENFVRLNKESMEKLKEIINFEIPIEYKSFEIEPFKTLNCVEFRLKKNPIRRLLGLSYRVNIVGLSIYNTARVVGTELYDKSQYTADIFCRSHRLEFLGDSYYPRDTVDYEDGIIKYFKEDEIRNFVVRLIDIYYGLFINRKDMTTRTLKIKEAKEDIKEIKKIRKFMKSFF